MISVRQKTLMAVGSLYEKTIVIPADTFMSKQHLFEVRNANQFEVKTLIAH